MVVRTGARAVSISAESGGECSHRTTQLRIFKEWVWPWEARPVAAGLFAKLSGRLLLLDAPSCGVIAYPNAAAESPTDLESSDGEEAAGKPLLRRPSDGLLGAMAP